MHAPDPAPGPLSISRVGVGRADRGPIAGPAWGRRRALALALGGEIDGVEQVFGLLLAVEAGGVAPGLGARAAAAAGLPGLATLTFASGAPGGPALDGGLGLDEVVGEAVAAALADLQPGSLGWGRALRWDLLRCTDAARVLRRRKLERGAAHLRTADPDAGLKRLIEELHADPAPPSLVWEAALCDPALPVLCARDAAGRPRLGLAWVGGREAGLPGPPREGGGVFGRAARLLEAQLWGRHRQPVHAAVLCGAGGDARLDVEEPPPHDLVRGAERAARRLSDALARALGEAQTSPPLALAGLVRERPEAGVDEDEGEGLVGLRFLSPTGEELPLLSAPRPGTPLLLAGLRRAGLRPLALGAARVRGVDPLPDGLKAALDRADRLELLPVVPVVAPPRAAVVAPEGVAGGEDGPAEDDLSDAGLSDDDLSGGGAADGGLTEEGPAEDVPAEGVATEGIPAEGGLSEGGQPEGGLTEDGPAGDGPSEDDLSEDGLSDADLASDAAASDPASDAGLSDPTLPEGPEAPAAAPAAPARKPRKPRPEPEPPPPPGAPTLSARVRGEGAEARAVIEGDAALPLPTLARGQAALRIEIGARIPEPKHPGGAKPKRPRPPRYTWSTLFWGGAPVDELHQTLRTGPAGDRWRWRFEAPLPPRWRGMAFRVVVDGVASLPDLLR
ncbi:MAG: hypothetical protein RL071_1484 [Pseudomonadota bacterium]|jgi:hypothetical protein